MKKTKFTDEQVAYALSQAEGGLSPIFIEELYFINYWFYSQSFVSNFPYSEGISILKRWQSARTSR